MKKVINAVVRIEYETTDKAWYVGIPNEDIESAAINLVINPNFNTKMLGVSIDSVHVESVDGCHLIDWDKVRHNPEYLFIKQ